MKRFAFIFTALALTGALAFGQDTPAVKVTGYVDAGFKGVKIDTGEFTTSSVAKDNGTNGVIGKLSGAVTAANYGAKVTVQATDTAAPVSIADAFVYFQPMEGFTINAGTTYSTVSFDGVDDASNDYFWANGLGATYSMSGVSVGARAAADAVTGVNLGFGAAYDLPDVASLRVSTQTAGKELTKFSVSANLKAVPNLGLSAGYLSEGLNTTADNWADLSVSYTVAEGVTVGVVAYDRLTKEYFTVKPNASYVLMPGVTLSAYYQLYTEGKNKIANPSDNEVQGKVAFAAGTGTLATWVQYNTAAKQLVLQADYVISF